MCPSRSSNRRGAVVVLVAILLVFVLFTVVAIDIDGGILLDARRHAQATADAGALAGAAILYTEYGSTGGVGSSAASDAALAATTQNGYPNSGSTRVTILMNPDNYQEGPNSGTQIPKGYIEVIVEKDQERYFSNIIVSGTILVKARAVARGKYEPNDDGIILLDLNADRALNAHGNGDFKVFGKPGGPAGRVIVNSNDENAAAYAGNNSTMWSEGGYSIYGAVNDPNLFTGGDLNKATGPVPDPMRYYPQPDKSLLSAGTVTSKSLGMGYQEYTLTPGVFTGGLDFGSKDTVIMQPGIFYMDQGGFSWSGQSGTSLTAAGVMIYNDPTSNSQDISITGQGSVSWSPPTTGAYAGIALWQNRDADVDITITGQGNTNIGGMFYAPNAWTKVTGNGDMTINGQFISRILDVGGNGAVSITYNAIRPPGIRVLQLVE